MPAPEPNAPGKRFSAPLRTALPALVPAAIVIDNSCLTSDAAVYAIGECALWNGKIFGLVAPGHCLLDRLPKVSPGKLLVKLR